MTPAPRDTPAVHAAIRRRLAAGPATRAELAEACGRTGSTLGHHLGEMLLLGDIRRVWGSRPTRLTLAGGQGR